MVLYVLFGILVDIGLGVIVVYLCVIYGVYVGFEVLIVNYVMVFDGVVIGVCCMIVVGVLVVVGI